MFLSRFSRLFRLRSVSTLPPASHPASSTAILVVLALGLLTPVDAGAQDFYKWCVDQLGGNPDFADCNPWAVCENPVPFATLQEVFDAARAVPDGSNGRPDHYVCVGTQGIHTETLDIDNSQSPTSMGPFMDIIFMHDVGPNYCPEPLAASEPAISVTGYAEPDTDPWLWLRYLKYFENSCDPSSVRSGPALSIDESSLHLIEARIVGGTGPAIVATSANEDVLNIVGTRIEGIEGPAIHSEAGLSLGETEISGCVAEGAPPDQRAGDGANMGHLRLRVAGQRRPGSHSTRADTPAAAGWSGFDDHKCGCGQRRPERRRADRARSR
jgi:hypothetical protein